eukprot:CAMPEP_0197175408 /NCGR_PEP_ID=MMETSP1423-20130617/1632_1 /TAXON_ID=476441 /ORGANISM="Pseudo-nitzschia heimii, Strain UNC1101" /LENGTH=221 /DNA_ID=CAMNT_0042624559 /DNA_START=25 /DNA_END=690 /DNA_ORIENTATION=-
MNIVHHSKVGMRLGFSSVILSLLFSTSLSFVISQKKNSIVNKFQIKSGIETVENPSNDESRRQFLRKAPTPFLSCMVGLRFLISQSSPALAADLSELPTREVVTECFDFIRFELENPEGGIAYMQGRIDKEDLAGLLEFSKSYDLEFRKRRFGAAKKLLQDKEVKAKATEYANAVTFDLIGINRSCRKGQEDKESANKYLNELRDDVTKFLALEKTIRVRS